MKKRFSEEQIIGILKEAEAGTKGTELCRRYGMSDATSYTWRQQYGGMAVSEGKRVRDLEEENRRLKQLLAATGLEKHALQEVVRKKWERRPRAGTWGSTGHNTIRSVNGVRVGWRASVGRRGSSALGLRGRRGCGNASER